MVVKWPKACCKHSTYPNSPRLSKVACDVPKTFRPTDMRMDAAVLLAPGIQAGSVPPTAVSLGRVAGLRRSNGYITIDGWLSYQ